MKIKINKGFGLRYKGKSYKAGIVVDVDNKTADILIANKQAEETKEKVITEGDEEQKDKNKAGAPGITDPLS
ncbi:MAG: hypothetical protein LBT51_01255 [Fusobacteriaceae bacterium]|jgi:hypothetical protein|nr:hypothetical protein [Fusobacteriaceae bacterium]